MEIQEGDIQVYSRTTKPKYFTVNVTSKIKSEFKAFSPFYLGPVEVEPFPAQKSFRVKLWKMLGNSKSI